LLLLTPNYFPSIFARKYGAPEIITGAACLLEAGAVSMAEPNTIVAINHVFN